MLQGLWKNDGRKWKMDTGIGVFKNCKRKQRMSSRDEMETYANEVQI